MRGAPRPCSAGEPGGAAAPGWPRRAFDIEKDTQPRKAAILGNNEMGGRVGGVVISKEGHPLRHHPHHARWLVNGS